MGTGRKEQPLNECRLSFARDESVGGLERGGHCTTLGMHFKMSQFLFANESR